MTDKNVKWYTNCPQIYYWNWSILLPTGKTSGEMSVARKFCRLSIWMGKSLLSICFSRSWYGTKICLERALLSTKLLCMAHVWMFSDKSRMYLSFSCNLWHQHQSKDSLDNKKWYKMYLALSIGLVACRFLSIAVDCRLVRSVWGLFPVGQKLPKKGLRCVFAPYRYTLRELAQHGNFMILTPEPASGNFRCAIWVQILTQSPFLESFRLFWKKIELFSYL